MDGELGLAPGAEVTTEANPDSVTAESLAQLRAGGLTASASGCSPPCRTCWRRWNVRTDRRTSRGRCGAARAAGIDQVSLDLIYGTAGESAADWQASLDTALALQPDHVSAYALVVEEGTRLAGQVRRGEVSAPDDDDLADKYAQADETLGAAGLGWYEVSNWARDDAARCRHNLGYWRGDDWWGAGPGAHSHVGGVRWWNVKHPAAYAERLTVGDAPAQAREVLDAGPACGRAGAARRSASPTGSPPTRRRRRTRLWNDWSTTVCWTRTR